MKIFLVNDKFFQEGGTEVYLRQIASRLKKIGHKPIIIYGEGPTSEQVSKEGFTSYQIAGLEEEFPRDRQALLERIREVINLENPDVIQLNNIPNAYVVNEFHSLVPTLRHIHDHRVYCPGFSKTWYRSNEICPIPFSYQCLVNAYREHCATNKPVKLLKKYQAKFYELEVNQKLPRIILASKFMSTQLEINNFDLNKVVILPHLVEIPKVVAAPKNKRQLLFVGRVTMEKGVQYAIEAMKYVDGLLTIVGTGPQMEEYQLLAKKLKVARKVRFVGEIPRKQVSQYYRETDVVVFPSIWPEPHGKSGPEAFAYGRPVVGFDSGGVREWLKDGFNGYLVPRLEVAVLAQKANYLLDNPKQAWKLGQNGREFVQKYMSQTGYLRKLLKTYQETIHDWNRQRLAS